MAQKGYTGLQARIAHSQKLNQTVPGPLIEEKQAQSDGSLPTTMPTKKYKKKQHFLQVCARVNESELRAR